MNNFKDVSKIGNLLQWFLVKRVKKGAVNTVITTSSAWYGLGSVIYTPKIRVLQGVLLRILRESWAKHLNEHIKKVPCYSSSNAIIVCLKREKRGEGMT